MISSAISLNQRRFESQILQTAIKLWMRFQTLMIKHLIKNSIKASRMLWFLRTFKTEEQYKNNWADRQITRRNSNNTSISLKMSRGPIISESYFTCALLVAKATEAYIIPFSFMRVDSILWTQEAHVIPLTWKEMKRSRVRWGKDRFYAKCCKPSHTHYKMSLYCSLILQILYCEKQNMLNFLFLWHNINMVKKLHWLTTSSKLPSEPS